MREAMMKLKQLIKKEANREIRSTR